MATVITIEAPRREAGEPDGLTIPFRGQDLRVPAELPADVLSPFFADELELVGTVRSVLSMRADADAGEDLVDVLLSRPNLPRGLLDALTSALRSLFGDEQWEQFQAGRPTLVEYARLIRGLVKAYGVGLGEAWASFGFSASDGTTSKPTSHASTTSTLAESGDTTRNPAS